MLLIKTDYQTATPDGYLLILRYEGRDVAEQAGQLGLFSGMTVMLDDEAADWMVEGTLYFQCHPLLLKEDWIARPDWSTAIRKRDSTA